MEADSPTTDGPGASREAIASHYDLSNAFYELWLDPRMTYSCALWDGDDDTLEAAQERKLDHMLAAAGLNEGDRLLDIGCGWGSALRRGVDVVGAAHATGLTLSLEQVRYVEALAAPAIDVHLMPWSAYEPDAPVDAIVSIGAFEHFARPDRSPAERVAGYRSFFERCHQWLRPGGQIGLQTIVRDNLPGTLDPYLQSIFPESELPTIADVAEASQGWFEIVTLRNDRLHYERTCLAWLRRLQRRSDEAAAIVGADQVARYEKYLRLCCVAFHTGKVGLIRVELRRVDRPHQLAARP